MTTGEGLSTTILQSGFKEYLPKAADNESRKDRYIQKKKNTYYQ